jgi:nucleobase:cation symporter-1, NCS1 family
MTATDERVAQATPFTLLDGDKHSEVPPHLSDPVPRSLSFTDQTALWGNLGVSLLGFTGAIFVLDPNATGSPTMSMAAALTAIVVGTVFGTLAIALSGLPGTITGAPAMVLLRGLFGARVSYVPTVMNILQCIGWGIFELVTIATAAHTVAHGLPRWSYILIGGVITTLLALRPLGWVRTMRRYVTVLVGIVLVYLAIELLRHPLPGFFHGNWNGYWIAMDTTIAVAVSFVPLAADYTRHSSSPKKTFWSTMLGYGVAQIVCYVLGLIALLTVAKTADDIYGAFIAVPVGSLAFAILAIRELDQSFANVYSTAVSTQNLRPRWDRRVLAIAVGTLATVGALALNINDYENFLLLLGSVFVPMFSVLAADFFLVSHGRWDLTETSPARWSMLIPWALGFITYQWINPGSISWWASMWSSINDAIDIHPAGWMSASLMSFVVAGLATLIIGRLTVQHRVKAGHGSPVTSSGSNAQSLLG